MAQIDEMAHTANLYSNHLALWRGASELCCPVMPRENIDMWLNGDLPSGKKSWSLVDKLFQATTNPAHQTLQPAQAAVARDTGNWQVGWWISVGNMGLKGL